MATSSSKNKKSTSNQIPPLVGVIHLPPLPGAPGSFGVSPEAALQEAGFLAVQQARALYKAGFQGIVIENFGDAPFYKEKVPPETIAALSIIGAAVREAAPKAFLGINVLRNDAHAALAIASVCGADFIRVNVLSGVAATDQGIIEGNAAELVRERQRLHSNVRIFADAHVKHAQTLSSKDIGLAIEEVAFRAGADAVIVTGDTTGRAINSETLMEAGRVCKAHGVPLYIGSGATPENMNTLRPWVYGMIVGSTLRKSGMAGAPLDATRMKRFVQAFRQSSKVRDGVRKTRT